MPPKKKKEPETKDVVLNDAQSQTISSTQLEQAVQQLLQQFGSQTQGSVQKPSQTESSTPPGSSTQNTKPSKQTVASYAQAYAHKKLPNKTFSQTLQPEASNSKALVSIPGIGTITKQQLDLIRPPPNQVLKIQTKSQIATPSLSAIIPTTQQNLDTPYVPKTNFQNLIQIEPEFFHPEPNQVAAKVFPPGFHFRPSNILKTREYYEFILVHSESADISRKVDPKDETLITHSTFQILKVLTPSQWGQDLNKRKLFGINYEPEGYTYWDYVDAWSNVFWDQNRNFKHTWFIYFKTKTEYKFPQWFNQWWEFFGPIPEIIPPKVMQAFEVFKQKFNHGEDPFPIHLHYFSKLSVSWIFSWQYRFFQTSTNAARLPMLQRIPYVRWWPKFDIRRVDEIAVDRWFKENPRHLCITEQSKFLNQRSRIQTMLATSTDKTSLVNQLETIMQLLQQTDQPNSTDQAASSSSENKIEEDEDDFVVDLDDD